VEALDPVFRWLTHTGIATTIHENEALFPWIESLHVLAITLVVGSIAIVDLRLLGFASLDRAVARVTDEVLPCTWIAFAVALLSGLALFSSNAVNYAHNPPFQFKMVLLLLAGINMGIFHIGAGRRVGDWPAHAHTPPAAKVAAACSLLLWIGVVGFGRWIGFTLQPTLGG
jgi:hypothetical protein